MSPRAMIGFLRNRHIKKRFALAAGLMRLSILRHLKRRERGWIRMIGYTMHYSDFDLFVTLFKEIFLHQGYRVDTVPEDALIIDAGSNIGVSVLYFAYQYPRARIVCFEPEPSNHAVLLKNVQGNGLTNVTVHQCALHDREGWISLYVRDTIAGGDIGASAEEEFRYHHHERRDIRAVSVPCRRLSQVLEAETKVDLLKIDVEGSEGIVFKEMAQSFGKVEHLVMEYHYLLGRNPLTTILALLEDYGHSYRIHGCDGDSAIRDAYTFLITSRRQQVLADHGTSDAKSNEEDLSS